jgi:hypothetical protein
VGFIPLELNCLDLVGKIFDVGGPPSMDPIWLFAVLALQQLCNDGYCLYRKGLLPSSFAFVTILCGLRKGLARMSLPTVWSFWTKSKICSFICIVFIFLGFVVRMLTFFVVNQSCNSFFLI